MTLAISHSATRLLTVAAVLAAALALPPSANAVSFALESTTVILRERDGQTAFNITNEGDRPLLLLTRLDDLGGPPMAGKILIAPHHPHRSRPEPAGEFHPEAGPAAAP